MSHDDSFNLFMTRHELCFRILFSSAQKGVRYCHHHIESDSFAFPHLIVMNPITFSPTPGYFFAASHDFNSLTFRSVFIYRTSDTHSILSFAAATVSNDRYTTREESWIHGVSNECTNHAES